MVIILNDRIQFLSIFPKILFIDIFVAIKAVCTYNNIYVSKKYKFEINLYNMCKYIYN